MRNYYTGKLKNLLPIYIYIYGIYKFAVAEIFRISFIGTGLKHIKSMNYMRTKIVTF